MADNSLPSEQEEKPNDLESEHEETSPPFVGTSRFGKLSRAIGNETPSSTATTNSSPAPVIAPTTEPVQPGYVPQYASRPPKDRNVAIILEILPGLFGLYGFGWIYSGNTGTGIMLLVGGLIWAVIVVIAATITASVACFCTVPVNLIAVAVSATMLNNYTKNHPELFGR